MTEPEIAKKSFSANLTEALEPEKLTYDHGFTEEQVIKIRLAREAITKRDLAVEPVTIAELKEVIIPWLRIHRTEAFNLNVKEEKPKKERKAREPKARTPREPKPKKLTKKAITAEINRLIMKQALGEELNQEEQSFFDQHTTKDF